MSDPFSISGKTALITGGTSGIGLATAKHFVSAGARVVITGRREEGETIAADIGAEFVPCDMHEAQQIDNMVEASAELLGGIDILFSNAGAVIEFLTVEETDDSILNDMFDVNALSHYRVLRRSIPHLNQGASVILNASLITRMGNIGETAYTAAKSALVGLARGAAMELAGQNIRVNAISPGPIDGPIWPADHPQRDLIKTLCPMGRFGNPEEIASICQFLGSDACQYLTGANIPVDGGITSGFAPQMLEVLMGE